LRAYLIVIVPALIVAAFYVAIFQVMGYEVRLAPFIGTAAAFLAAIMGVRRYRRRKRKRQS
jgi:hypothetical protein